MSPSGTRPERFLHIKGVQHQNHNLRSSPLPPSRIHHRYNLAKCTEFVNGHHCSCYHPRGGQADSIDVTQVFSPRDILPTSLLKTCIRALATAIAHMANLWFKEWCCPSRFKSAQILPLLKKPSLDSEVFANYKLISNPSTISKIFERLALVN